MNEKPSRLWVVVADPGRARVFSVASDADAWTLLTELQVPADPALVSLDRPRAAVAKPDNTLHFARHLAEIVDSGNRRDLFDHLAIVAPPRFAQTLRASCETPVEGRLAAVIDKELTHLLQGELQAALSPLIAERVGSKLPPALGAA